MDPRNPVAIFLHDITEPILSPLLAIILLNLVANAATRLLI